MKVLITGADGFVGKNLIAFLSEHKSFEIIKFTKDNNEKDLLNILPTIEFIFHLAGVNRPKNEIEFKEGNTDFTKKLCDTLFTLKKAIPILYSSSIQAELSNAYGKSKYDAEQILIDYSKKLHVNTYIFRLPNVFGKWAKPNYNSAVATFCYNISQGLPIQVNDPNAKLNLVYIDDVIFNFYKVLTNQISDAPYVSIKPIYQTTVGFVASQINHFNSSRQSLITEKVGEGLVRALYSTYVSYLTPKQFSYKLVKHTDARGVFVEFLKTKDSGQFSFFTAHPGVTRGGHYHHSKTEKFLVIKGKAKYGFRQIITNEYHEIFSSSENPEVVETIPGWAHDITNIGDDEMVVMLWANEIFDKEQPDTFASGVKI